jgi:hypothetical protein
MKCESNKYRNYRRGENRLQWRNGAGVEAGVMDGRQPGNQSLTGENAAAGGSENCQWRRENERLSLKRQWAGDICWAECGARCRAKGGNESAAWWRKGMAKHNLHERRKYENVAGVMAASNFIRRRKWRNGKLERLVAASSRW